MTGPALHAAAAKTPAGITATCGHLLSPHEEQQIIICCQLYSACFESAHLCTTLCMQRSHCVIAPEVPGIYSYGLHLTCSVRTRREISGAPGKKISIALASPLSVCWDDMTWHTRVSSSS